MAIIEETQLRATLFAILNLKPEPTPFAPSG